MSTNDEKLTAKQKALKMLEDGQIPVNEKTGKPTIKDIMEKAGISRSYAYAVRRRFKRVQEAKEGPAPSDVEIEEPSRLPKPPPPPPRREEKKEAEEEIEAERRIPMTREEMEEELDWFEDSIKDFYDFLIGKDESVVTVVLGPEYGRSDKTTRKLAHRWKQWARRRIDPDTMEGWDTYFLLGDHIFGVLFPIGVIYWRNLQKKKEEKKKEGE